MSLDVALTDLASLGWLINNAYQPDGGLWRVSLRKPALDGDWFSSWAEAPTFAEALEEAMSKLTDATFEDHPTQLASITQGPSLMDALALTFAPTTAPIRRRV